MERKFLIEFEDFDWYPTSFRNVQTDFLQIIMEQFDVFKEVYPKLFDLAKTQDIYHFRDLCSGGGGAIMQMRKHYKNTFNKPFNATLTDKYPNINAYKSIALKSGQEIDFVSKSVDVNGELAGLGGIWTVFNAFHHLSPLSATRLLRKAVRNNRPIAIMEPLDTNPLVILLQSLVLVAAIFLILPFTKSFNLKIFFLSYLFPVLPLAIVWDGWVSALKVYRIKALKRMVVLADKKSSFTWDIGYANHNFGKIVYLLGSPINSKN